MPIFQAKQRCPDGIFIPPRMKRYKEVSRAVMAILSEFSPQVQLELFDTVEEKDHNWEKVDRALETITQKFGRDAIKRAALKDPY